MPPRKKSPKKPAIDVGQTSVDERSAGDETSSNENASNENSSNENAADEDSKIVIEDFLSEIEENREAVIEAVAAHVSLELRMENLQLLS